MPTLGELVEEEEEDAAADAPAQQATDAGSADATASQRRWLALGTPRPSIAAHAGEPPSCFAEEGTVSSLINLEQIMTNSYLSE